MDFHNPPPHPYSRVFLRVGKWQLSVQNHHLLFFERSIHGWTFPLTHALRLLVKMMTKWMIQFSSYTVTMSTETSLSCHGRLSQTEIPPKTDLIPGRLPSVTNTYLLIFIYFAVFLDRTKKQNSHLDFIRPVLKTSLLDYDISNLYKKY